MVFLDLLLLVIRETQERCGKTALPDDMLPSCQSPALPTLPALVWPFPCHTRVSFFEDAFENTIPRSCCIDIVVFRVCLARLGLVSSPG